MRIYREGVPGSGATLVERGPGAPLAVVPDVGDAVTWRWRPAVGAPVHDTDARTEADLVAQIREAEAREIVAATLLGLGPGGGSGDGTGAGAEQ